MFGLTIDAHHTAFIRLSLPVSAVRTSMLGFWMHACVTFRSCHAVKGRADVVALGVFKVFAVFAFHFLSLNISTAEYITAPAMIKNKNVFIIPNFLFPAFSAFTLSSYHLPP